MEMQNETELAHSAVITTNGNNGQVAIGGTVIQFGPVNGGTVNLMPAGSPPGGDDPALHLPASEKEALVALRQVLSSLFDEEELRDLVFDLAIEYDNLPGAAKKDKARELVAFYHRRGRISDLKLAILRRRPGAL